MRAFARAVITVPRALDADLLRGQGMSLSEYNTLMNLSKAPGQRLADKAAVPEARGSCANTGDWSGREESRTRPVPSSTA